MKKIKFCALAALLIGFSACKNDDKIDKGALDGGKGNTFMSININMERNASARAGEDDHNKKGTWEGNDNIKTLDIYLVSATTLLSQTLTPGQFTIGAKNATDDSYNVKSEIFKVSVARDTESFTAYALVNATPKAKELLNGATKDNFATKFASLVAKADIAKIETEKDVIMMSGKGTAFDIKKNVSRDEAAAGANKAVVSVKRTAARVIVTFDKDKDKADAEGTFEVKSANNTVLGTVKELKWTVAQDEKQLYLQQKTTPNFGESEKYAHISTAANYSTSVMYDYSQLSSKIDVVGYTKATAGAFDIASLVKLTPKFVAETTHADADYRKGNTAYVLIQGKFTPSDAILGGKAGNAATKSTITDPTGTFWVGMDGKVYGAEADAKAYNKNDSKRVFKHDAGKVFYFAWLNPDAATVKSPVYRNQIYHVNISAFIGIGPGGNPLVPDVPTDPTNPNNPDKPDPNDPINPSPEDPLKNPKTYVSAEVTVLSWGMHSYDATLDPND